jgi:hypothetical protein
MQQLFDVEDTTFLVNAIAFDFPDGEKGEIIYHMAEGFMCKEREWKSHTVFCVKHDFGKIEARTRLKVSGN